MINLTTGAPGAGKTLYTLYYVQQLAEREGRTVYYSGIADLKVPGWIELEDPAKWYDMPAGSIVIIDECQRLFRPRGSGSAVPEYVSRLETHRHAGLDLFLITQHPMLVDNNVRRLCGTHRHVVRSFGMQRCTVHEWGSVKEQCDKSRADSVRHEVSYPKHVFGWYKSAEVHTVKRRIPGRVWLLLCLPFVLAALVYSGYRTLSDYGDAGGVVKASGGVPGGLPAGAAPTGAGVPRAVPVVASGPDWFAERQARIPELPHTAPIYDAVTAPRQAPVPSLCMQMGAKCKCYTSQATVLGVSESICRQIVERGYFMDWQEPGPAAQGVRSVTQVAQKMER